MADDVRSKHISTSGQVVSGAGRLRGIVVCYKTGATGGMTIYDSDEAAGDICLAFSESPEGTVVIPIPGTGTKFDVGLNAVIPSNTTLTVFYQT